MKTINYKGKGEHSVRELELIIEQQSEELHLIKSRQNPLIIDSVSGCPFEAYAVFCIECDRQGIKPIKHKDYLEMG